MQTEVSNPQQAAAIITDPYFDDQAMRDPETYFMPAPSRVADLDKQNLGEFNMECAICQEKFTRQSMVCQMPCHIKHIFHSECITPWI